MPTDTVVPDFKELQLRVLRAKVRELQERGSVPQGLAGLIARDLVLMAGNDEQRLRNILRKPLND